MTEYYIAFSNDKTMANGMRYLSRVPLTDSEIEFVIKEIERIKADKSIFVFNDKDHIATGTCYNFADDKIYITKNVFPDEKYGFAHPRDIMSVAAVLAHEYYGHRQFRKEYLDDLNRGENYHTTPIWQDECRASLYAAQIAPGLERIERRDLILDAVYRAEEYGHRIETTKFMKEVLYGYKDERGITMQYEQPKYIETNQERDTNHRETDDELPDLSRNTDGYDLDER